MNFEQFCQDHNIPIAPEGHKHGRPGWIQVECPLCVGNAGYHLGYHIEKQYFNCWRCGWHTMLEAIKGLLQCSDQEARHQLMLYKGVERPRQLEERKPKEKDVKVQLPLGTKPMTALHRKYLRQRKFDPDELEKEWGLLGTGPLGPYKFRIIAPIYFEKKLVSYQGRDVTNKSKLRYMACASENEARDHKECLYGYDLVMGDTVVVVEGIADAWRLGPGAVATFGVKYKLGQVALLRKFKRRFILFDNPTYDPEAGVQAHKLANLLTAFDGTTEVLTLEDWKDPGVMPQEEADALMRDISIR